EVLGPAGEHMAAGAMVGLYPDGHIRYLGTAIGHGLVTPVAPDPAERARGFLLAHRAAFGLPANADAVLEKSQQDRGRTYHRFQHTLGGLPVLGAEPVRQLDARAALQAVM